MIHICIYSFYEDSFLVNCLNSIDKSDFKDYVIDLYIFSKRGAVNVNELYEFPKIEISIFNKRKSFSEITNISIKKAKESNCDYFLLLNSDTILQQNCLSYLVNVLAFENNLGVIGGFQTEYSGEWNEPNNWSKEILKSVKSKENLKLNGENFVLHKCVYVQGACMLIKSAIFNQVGGFDERFKFFYEETEFCRRVQRNHFDIGILEEAKVKHFSGGTWKKNTLLHYRRDVYYLTNQIIFESTINPASKMKLLKDVFSIAKKQIKNLLNKNDSHKLPVVFYPVVILNLLYRINFINSLYKEQSTS
ncbi:MAG: glycosyltransferase family 2 protein [Candidatus Firestonebacteria bacterium]